MIAYVDENGNITDTPPDPQKKIEVKLEDIEIGVPKNEESEEYMAGDQKARRIFETPAKKWLDPQENAWMTETGTEDINWCHRVITERILEKAGWKEHQAMEYPFLVDTNIFCRHIDMNGRVYPSMGEERYFTKEFKEGLKRVSSNN